MASTLIAMASTLIAMASTLIAMAKTSPLQISKKKAGPTHQEHSLDEALQLAHRPGITVTSENFRAFVLSNF